MYLTGFADEAAKDLDGQIEALRENSISLLELRHIDGKNVMALSVDEAKRIHAALSAQNIGVWALGSPLGKVRESVNLPAYLEKTKRLCETAHALRCENIRAFSFYPRFRSFHEEPLFEKLGAILNCVVDSGLHYCHENEKGIFGSTLPRVQRLLDAFPKMDFVYDPANFLQCGQRPEDTVPALAKRARYFHLKDAQGKKVVPAGFGDGALKTLFSSLDRDVVLSIEPHLRLFRGSEAFDRSDLSGRFNLRSPRGRFDCAVAACRTLLSACGYRDCGSYFEK